MNEGTARTKDEICRLKTNWCSDPCWDIEETEGFEAHYDELLAYRKEIEAQREQEWFDEVDSRATELKCSFELAKYIILLEVRLDKMNKAMEMICFR